MPGFKVVRTLRAREVAQVEPVVPDVEDDGNGLRDSIAHWVAVVTGLVAAGLLVLAGVLEVLGVI
jgi:hypothetical protein